MITSTSSPTIESNSFTTNNFSIELNESVFTMLTSKVYNDPIKAVIREWSTNATDACIFANNPIHFESHIPTTAEPYLAIRDYGTGLSEEDILGLFSTFGASTKRNSNNYNGSFG